MRSSRFFPPIELADANGLLAVGGRLTTPWLVDAYTHGIFPWPSADGTIYWCSPDPRPILEFDELHVSKRLARTCRSGRFHITCDRAFAEVIETCATIHDRGRFENMWIIPEMRTAYCRLHELGIAHSVEAWHEGDLAGGVYGVSLGGAFFAESMFFRVRDASKVAVVRLVRHLAARGFHLLDIQQLTPHTARLGAREIARATFLRRLETAVSAPVTFGDALEG